MFSLSMGKKALPRSTMSHRPQPLKALKQQTQLVEDATPSKPSVSSTHNQVSEDLEFAKLQDQHETLFAQELEQHKADYEERQRESEAFLQELESQFSVAESRYQERFDSLVKEQDNTHQKKLDLRVIQFSASEKARQDIFLDAQSCRNHQFMELKDDWEKRFAEGRKLREKLLNTAGEEMGEIAASLMQEFEERFQQEEKEREMAFQRLVEELKRPNQSNSDDESGEPDTVPLVFDHARPEPNELSNTTSMLSSGYESIHDSDGSSPPIVCGTYLDKQSTSFESPEEVQNNDVPSQSMVPPPPPHSPPPPKPAPIGSIDCMERVNCWLDQCPDKFSDHDQPIHESPQLEDMGSSIGDSPSIRAQKREQSTPNPPPDYSKVESPPRYQEEFEDAQTMRQQLFEQSESAAFAAISGFNNLFDERLSEYRARFSSAHKVYDETWKVADHARDVEENGRNEMARVAETRRKGVFKELLKRMQDELALATKKEETWDQHQMRLATRAGEKLLRTKRTDIEHRSKETMHRWEDTLSSLLGHEFTTSPSLYVSRTGSLASCIASSIAYELAYSVSSGTSEPERSIADAPTFAFRSLFSKMGPLIERSRPVPNSPPSERSMTEVGAPRSDDFQSAQQQRDLAFRSSAEKRRIQHERNEGKRQQEFKLGQRQGSAGFHQMRTDQDRIFQDFLIDSQKRFFEEETSREVAWNKAELAREESFWDNQEWRARQWNDGRERLLVASFAAEQRLLESLETWVGETERWFETEKTAYEEAASARKERFEGLIDRATKSSAKACFDS